MTVAEVVRAAAHPLTGAAEDYDRLMDLIGDARFCYSARRPMARPPAVNFISCRRRPMRSWRCAVRIQGTCRGLFYLSGFYA